MTPPLTDAELDHRAEVARIDGNYLALELIRELRQLHTRIEAMAAVVAAAEAWRDCPIGFEHPAPFPDSLSGKLEIAIDSYRAALDGYRGAK